MGEATEEEVDGGWPTLAHWRSYASTRLRIYLHCAPTNAHTHTHARARAHDHVHTLATFGNHVRMASRPGGGVFCGSAEV